MAISDEIKGVIKWRLEYAYRLEKCIGALTKSMPNHGGILERASLIGIEKRKRKKKESKKEIQKKYRDKKVRDRDFREDAQKTVVLVVPVWMAYISLDSKSPLVIFAGSMEVPLCVILC